MRLYCLGFVFSQTSDGQRGHVFLIRKNRPKWQVGMLNGVGGHIEKGESPEEAMQREFKEEADLNIGGWEKFAVMSDGKIWTCHCFTKDWSASSVVQPYTNTDEEIVRCPVRAVLAGDEGYPVIPNLRWLIPMALESNGSKIYNITEVVS